MHELYETRLDHGLTQKELAKRLNVSEHAVQHWEYGRSYPSIKNLVKLSLIFDKPIDELLAGERLYYTMYPE